eukprot:532583-Prymnesium_polylepis.1
MAASHGPGPVLVPPPTPDSLARQQGRSPPSSSRPTPRSSALEIGRTRLDVEMLSQTARTASRASAHR